MCWDRFATATPSMIKSHIFLLLATLLATVFASMLVSLLATSLCGHAYNLVCKLGSTRHSSSSSNQSQVQRRGGGLTEY